MSSESLSVIVLAREEEVALPGCLASLRGLGGEIVVVDSSSRDRTALIATEMGARVVQFEWNGAYPKKKEWALRNSGVQTDWVLLLDADERVSVELGEEIRDVLSDRLSADAYDIPLSYYWRGRELRHGQTTQKRSLLRRSRSKFPSIEDLVAPGGNEVEGHYQPVVAGQIGRLRGRLIHDDPDPVSDWFARHNRYSDWEAYLRVHPSIGNEVRKYRSRQGQLFDRLPMKSIIIFLYNFVGKAGWRDGRVGLEFAVALAFYQFQIAVKSRELKSRPASRS